MPPNPRDPEARVVELREQRLVIVATGPSTIPDGLLQRVPPVHAWRGANRGMSPVTKWITNSYPGFNSSYLDTKLPPPFKGSSGFDKFFKKNTRR